MDHDGREFDTLGDDAVEVLEQLPAPALRDVTLELLEERLRDAGVGS